MESSASDDKLLEVNALLFEKASRTDQIHVSRKKIFEKEQEIRDIDKKLYIICPHTTRVRKRESGIYGDMWYECTLCKLPMHD